MTECIWKRRGDIDRERQRKMQELMDEYDRTVYYPAKKQLYQDCYKEGHSGGKFHDNGLGWVWFYCGKCGGRYNIEGPDGQRSPDSGAPDSN